MPPEPYPRRRVRGPRVDTISSPGGRVLVIGCGAIGTVIAGHLARSPSVSELRLADLDGGLAQALATRLGAPPKVTARALDASDPGALESALDGVRVVVQASLPRLNAGIKSAALATGTDYLDMACESTDPYRDSDEWTRRGRTAVVGMGEDPGLSNVLARFGADRLDRVTAIRVRDGDSATHPELPFLPLFSPETFIEETLNSSRIWDRGKYRTVPPFGEPEVYPFPAPVGPMTVYSVDHEEVDSLPRFIGKGVDYVDFKLALDDSTVRTLRLFRDLKLLDRGTPGAPGPRRALLAALPKPADLAGQVDGYACLIVEVDGEREGRTNRLRLAVQLSHREAYERFQATATAHLTGTPAAVATLQLLSGRISVRGVLPGEALDPLPFFPLLAERGIPVTFQETVERRAGA